MFRGTCRRGAGTVSERSEDERRSRPERSFATLGQSERSRETCALTGPAKISLSENLAKTNAKIKELLDPSGFALRMTVYLTQA